jgi:hypothetical protein
MSSVNQGVSVAVRALDALPDDQLAVYSARYMAEEPREVTCARLNMAPEHYDQLLAQTLRSLRRMVSSAPSQTASA